jgi:peptidoglycan/LPS O-acetylase OafA/YrhL
MNARSEITDLTICRAAFAGWVFLYHVDLYVRFSDDLGPAAGLVRSGYLGVDGFFLLSGLILSKVHPELAFGPEMAPRFWGKRLARIYPVHVVTIAVLAVLVLTGLALGFAPREPQRFTLLSLIENLLLVHGWGVSDFLAWNYPSWSVSTEWAGYLMFPVLWYFIGKWEPLINGGILVILLPSLGALAYFSNTGLNLTYGWALLRFFPEFTMGMLTARLVPVWADELPAKWLAFIGLAIAAAGAWLQSDTTVVFALLLLLYGLTMRADCGRDPVFGKSRALLFLGRLSYAFYMSFCTAELLVTQAFRHWGYDPAGRKLLFFASMLVLTFAYALILHVFVEVPARRAADKWLAAPPPLAGGELRL